jgi:hypothetical protein
VVDNELSQLDSSVYTQIFIPSDGEINPTAFKYRDQVRWVGWMCGLIGAGLVID